MGDLNPLNWLGDAATEAVGQTWTAVMVAAWSSGLWILSLAFKGVDAFTSPDLSAGGPMREIYPYTFGLGLMVALIMAFAQIGVAAFKRDGQSIARVMIGVAQFGAASLAELRELRIEATGPAANNSSPSGSGQGIRHRSSESTARSRSSVVGAAAT